MIRTFDTWGNQAYLLHNNFHFRFPATSGCYRNRGIPVARRLAVSLPVFLLTATTFGLEDVKDLRSVQPFGFILTVACAVVFFFMVSVGFVNLILVASI